MPLSRSLFLFTLLCSLAHGPVCRSAVSPTGLVSVEIRSGLRLEQVAEALAEAGLVGVSEFMAAAIDPALVKSMGLPGDSLEGYIQPGTFLFVSGIEPALVLKTLCAGHVKRFDQQARERAAELGLSEHDVIVLASIVERTTSDPALRRKTALVLLNRLRRGWHLDSRASLSHALKLSNSEFRGPPGRLDYRIEHPYNTFAHLGLPPGPLCSPSPQSVAAVLDKEGADNLVLFRDPSGEVALDLSAEQAESLSAIRVDPQPEETTRGLHYVVSNEIEPYYFRPAIERLGGVHIGVGAEQNYLMAGWSRPDILILMDFDQVIVDLHLVYRVAFLSAETPEEFKALWHKQNLKRFRTLIRDSYSDRKERIRALKALRLARRAVVMRMEKLAQVFARVPDKYFLNDPEQYGHMVALYRAGRVFAIRGDLTAWRTMRDMGLALSEQGRVVRTLYMSNAEQYFKYERSFRKNIKGLPTDEWSLILRTRPTNADYTYVLQWYDNFKRWMDNPRVRSVHWLAPRRQLTWRRPILQVLGEPPEVRKKVRGKGKGRGKVNRLSKRRPPKSKRSKRSAQ